MSDERRDRGERVVFNIGSQQGVVSNVAGDQYLQYAGRDISIDTRGTINDLRRSVEAAGLGWRDRREARTLLDSVDQEVARPQPDRARIATPLKRLTELLKETGALVSAANQVRPPLERLIAWLGAAGVGIAQLLP